MDTLSAFAMGNASRGRPLMVFDWDKAARFICARQPEFASAGLRGDWEYTGGTIFRDGKPYADENTYLASTWAKPELDLDGDVMECWIEESEAKVKGWDSGTKWPESALAILSTKGS